MKTCVIIPTYNEAKAIAGLVKEIRLQNLDVLVVDDGSSDNTSQIAEACGATVLRNQINQGKGASLIMGFNYALSRNYEAVITMDGDGQHLPEDIPYFIRLAKYSDSAIFIGNRMLKAKTIPLVRLITNRFMSWLLSCIAKQKIPDTQCGFRLIKQEVLKRVPLVTSKYETESEILVRSSRLGFKVESVPIKTIYLGEKSQINPFIDTLRFFRFLIRELWTTQY
jgi:glycosyltransferase involved in cell wall biosynthesis